MVRPVYLFIGQDSLSKDIQLKKLKQEFLDPQTEQFNLDTLHAKDLSLALLQERLLCLPVKARIRMAVVSGVLSSWEARLMKSAFLWLRRA